MVSSCVVPNCENHFSPRRNISYFRFPNPSKYPQVHKAWLAALNRPYFKPSQSSCFCELHFNAADFDETYKMKKTLLPNYYFRPILKREAVPKLKIDEVKEEIKTVDDKGEILKELLGEGYSSWKTNEGKDSGSEVETFSSYVNGGRRVDKGEAKLTDFIMKKPLAPLPAPLQRIIPTILNVVIKEDSSNERIVEVMADRGEAKLTATLSNCQRLSYFRKIKPRPAISLNADSAHKAVSSACDYPFSCLEVPLAPYSCGSCPFSTHFKRRLLEHRTFHRGCSSKKVYRQAKKMYKNREYNSYRCINCDFVTFSRLVLLRHVCVVEEVDVFGEVERISETLTSQFCKDVLKGVNVK